MTYVSSRDDALLSRLLLRREMLEMSRSDLVEFLARESLPRLGYTLNARTNRQERLFQRFAARDKSSLSPSLERTVPSTSSRTMVSPGVGNVSLVRRGVDITIESPPRLQFETKRDVPPRFLFPLIRTLSSLLSFFSPSVFSAARL